MGPGKGADRPSCLAMNPNNVAASAARRERLLWAFLCQSEDTQADLLELAEEISHAAGDSRYERNEVRALIHQLYVTAGWEESL